MESKINMRSNKVLLLAATFALVAITAIISLVGIQASNNAYYDQYLQTTSNANSSDSLDTTPKDEAEHQAINRFANNRFLAQVMRSTNNNRPIRHRTCLITKIVDALLQQIEISKVEKRFYLQDKFPSYKEIFCCITLVRARPLA
jgi:DNA gyrase/topoisomerase IV subunit A